MRNFIIQNHGTSQCLYKRGGISQYIRNHNYIEITYDRLKDKATVTQNVKPVAIIFSESYFYITVFIDDKKIKTDFDFINDCYPTIYRINRIKQFKILEDSFHISYKERFQEGEFCKSV